MITQDLDISYSSQYIWTIMCVNSTTSKTVPGFREVSLQDVKVDHTQESIGF